MKNLSVRIKVLLLAVIMLVITCIVAAVGIFSNHQSKQAVDDMYHYNLMTTQYLNDATTQMRFIESDINYLLLTTYPQENKKILFEDMTGRTKSIQADMDKIKEMFGNVKSQDGKSHNMTEYMVPYMYGTLGILYNTSVVSQEELEKYGWGVLWNVQKNPKLENKILMKDSVRDTYAAAIFYMYEYNLLPEKYKDYTVQQLINCTDDEMIAAAEKVLTAQREHISGYEVDFGKDDMINEIVYADFAWSGDALWAIEEGGYDEETETYQLDYYVPDVASNIWYDGWCIPTSVNNKLAAMMFIDYMCNPMSSIRNSVAIGYTSATDKNVLMNDEDVFQYLIDCEYAEDETDFSYFEDTRRYPTINETLGVMRDFGKRNDTVVNMWQRAKSGDGVDVNLWYIILAIVGAIGLCVGTYFIVQAIKLCPRKLQKSSQR